jgi:hypothetical protein
MKTLENYEVTYKAGTEVVSLGDFSIGGVEVTHGMYGRLVEPYHEELDNPVRINWGQNSTGVSWRFGEHWRPATTDDVFG